MVDHNPTADVNDVDAVMALRADWDATVHELDEAGRARFSFHYESTRPALAKLYDRAQSSQWRAEDLDWSIDVDPEREAAAARAALGRPPAAALDPHGPFASFGEREWLEFAVQSQRWTLSQFLHGEQGALLCTSQLVTQVPDMDAKFYGATQVVDEARHVEVFARYTHTKLGGAYPLNAHLGALLDDVLSDSRWDMTYLGMQIMVEGLALASFGYMRQLTAEPLLAELLRRVMSDEARHVAFGVLSLADVYAELSAAELAERQEFAFEAALRMRDRLLSQEVYEYMGLDVRAALSAMMSDPNRGVYQAMLFSKIVPNCRKLGLLDANDGWLRNRFAEIGVIQFEHAEDTGEEYTSYDLATSS